MKRIAFICLFVLSGCATDMDRRLAYLRSHPKTSLEIHNAILEGKIREGMTQEEVAASWGNPCFYCYGTRSASWGDTWEYNPFGTGRYSVGSGTYLFFDRNGRLTGWSR